MTRTCIGAHTVPGWNYPPYVSINVATAGKISITVRSPAGPAGECGVTACMEMGEVEFHSLLNEIQERRANLKRTQVDGIPRRCRIDLLTAAEFAIYYAMQEVEKLPADVRLTEAVILLAQARDKVADFID